MFYGRNNISIHISDKKGATSRHREAGFNNFCEDRGYSRIYGLSVCRSAANFLGLPHYTTRFSRRMPRGCNRYHRNGIKYVVFNNIGGYGQRNSASSPICQVPRLIKQNKG